MCGIVGYVGPQEASEFLVEGLRRLEYRGYVSAGIAVVEAGEIGDVLEGLVGEFLGQDAITEGAATIKTRRFRHERAPTSPTTSYRRAHKPGSLLSQYLHTYKSLFKKALNRYKSLR